MESIKEFPRGITDQAISDSTATANDSVRPGPGQVSSYKLQATSHKLQAASDKLQALGEAASSKR